MIKTCIGHDPILLFDAAVYDLREKSQTSHSEDFNFDWFGTGKRCNQNQSPRRRVVNLMRKKKLSEWLLSEITLIWPCAELHRGLTSSWLSPSNLAAAHLAGFMGKELTSGRLPCYPSSVWKLIPSSVSKPRDPLAGGITWVSAVGASPSPLPPLWTADVLSTWDTYCFKSVSSALLVFTSSILPIVSRAARPSLGSLSIDQAVEVRAVGRSRVTVSPAADEGLTCKWTRGEKTLFD